MRQPLCSLISLVGRSSQQDAAADTEDLLLRNGLVVDVGRAAVGAVEGVVVAEGLAVLLVLPGLLVNIMGSDMGISRIFLPMVFGVFIADPSFFLGVIL